MATTAERMQARIDRLDGLIEAYTLALEEFAANGLQKSYEFNSGQQEITVERADPEKINRMIEAWMNEQQKLCIRLGQARPGVTARGRW